MPDVCSDLIAELVQDHGVARLVDERVYGGWVPSGVTVPFVWIQRRGIRSGTDMEAEAEPLAEVFDVECVAANATTVVELSDAVRAWSKSWTDAGSATMGDNVYTWVSVTDAAEDYVPRNIDAAEALFISSLTVEVYRP